MAASDYPQHTPILCPHGKATSWTGVASVRELLPTCEHCSECVAALTDENDT
jgi:hypothetical protein